jgi:hypothetical protein
VDLGFFVYIEVISTRQVLVLEVGEYQGGFRDRVDGLMVRVERGWRRRDGPVDLRRAHC